MGPGAGKRTSGKTQRTAAHSPAGKPARAMPRKVQPMVSGKPKARSPHIAEQAIQAAANTTLHVDAKNIAVSQLTAQQSREVRSIGRAARRAANAGDSASQAVAASVDAKNVAVGQATRGQRKEVTRSGREARRASPSAPTPNGRNQMMLSGDEIADARAVAGATKARQDRKATTAAGREQRMARSTTQPVPKAGGAPGLALSAQDRKVVADVVKTFRARGRSTGGAQYAEAAKAFPRGPNATLRDVYLWSDRYGHMEGGQERRKLAEFRESANSRGFKLYDKAVVKMTPAERQAVSYERRFGKSAQGVSDKQISQAIKDNKPAAGATRAAAPVAPTADKPARARGASGRLVAAAAQKTKIAAADTMTGLKQLQGVGNKAMYGLAVATPAMFATSALVHGTMGWNRAKESGASNLQAAGSAAAGAAPAAVALAAPTIIGRTAPKLAAIVSKAALPLTALAAGIGAGVGAYKAYQRGASAGGIVGGAALGMADTFTGGLATTAWTKWAGSGSGDATTLAITNHAASGAPTASAQSGATMAGSQPPKLTADAAKRFNAAEKTYRSAQEAGGSERQPAEKPEPSGRKPGFGPEAIIASYYKRNPGGTNAPYGGDPTQAEGYIAPAAPKDKKL